MSKKKKNVNPIDDLIIKLAEQFRNIPNLDLINTDPQANKMFQFAVRRFGGLHDYKTLFAKAVIPAVNKSKFEMKEYARKSAFRELAPKMVDEIEENFNEIIRIAYVGMFHKYENFIYELQDLAEKMVNEAGKQGLVKYIKDTFNFKFLDWLSSDITHRINWISNCIKHKDGYPVKEDPPISYMLVDKSKKIVLTKDEFIADVDLLLKQMELALIIMKAFVMHMITFNDEMDTSLYSTEFIERQKAIKIEVEDKIKAILLMVRAKTGIQISENLQKLISDNNGK
jgi:hypothetical protein